MSNYRFIISGGGTGGHIFPAVAIADELKRRYPNAEFLFVGAKDRMEMEKVPQAGYEIEGLWISGIQRSLSLSNLMFPFKLISSLWKSLRLVKKFKPHAVVGTGGFASGPLLKAAAIKNVPYVLQEQNSFAGITNKWLAKDAYKICVAYEQMENYFPKDKIVFTGNPVRAQLLQSAADKNQALTHFGLEADKKVLLVIGGSLGARRINQLLVEELDFITTQGYQVLWQCGKYYFETYKDKATNTVKVLAFVDRMDLAYAAADIIISRAGAGSVSELCLVGKPVLFIPSPNVAEDHQTKNAEAMVNKNAALMLKENELKDKFRSVFQSDLMDVERCNQLGIVIRELARPNATADIVDQIETILK